MFTTFSSASIADCEQVNVSWVFRDLTTIMELLGKESAAFSRLLAEP